MTPWKKLLSRKPSLFKVKSTVSIVSLTDKIWNSYGFCVKKNFQKLKQKGKCLLWNHLLLKQYQRWVHRVLFYQNTFYNGHEIYHFHITKNGSTDLLLNSYSSAKEKWPILLKKDYNTQLAWKTLRKAFQRNKH